ncbi:MAG: transcription factor E [Methanobacteriota archaeon]|nr:MAG: transcription factor E [Euryarchaeota archaeon]
MDNGSAILENPEVRQFFEEVLGEEGLKVINALIGREATDEEIAEELGLKLNLVRKILYKLYDYRLASYVRTKDKDIGWYIYTWKLDLPRVMDVIQERKRKILEDLTNKLEYEANTVFFECTNDHFRIPYDIASERGFRCPQCEGALEYINNQEAVESLEREIRRLQDELENPVPGALKAPRM